MVVLRLAVEHPARSIGQVSKQQTDETEDGSEGNGDVLADPAAGETRRKEPANSTGPSYQELVRLNAEQDRRIAEIIAENDRRNAEKDRLIAVKERENAEKERENALLKDRLIEALSQPSPTITTETPTGK